MFEWNFLDVSQSHLEDTAYVYLTLWNRTGAITGSNLVDLGVLRRAKSHQHPKNTVINSKIRRYQNKIRFSIGANVIIKRNCVFNGWLSAKLVNGSYIFNVYQDFKTLKTEFYSFHRSKRLRIVQTQAILFWNQCREESDTTRNDFEIEWWISKSIQNRLKITTFKFGVVLYRIRLFPTLISNIEWVWSEQPLMTYGP